MHGRARGKHNPDSLNLAQQKPGCQYAAGSALNMIYQLLDSFYGPAVVLDKNGVIECGNSYLAWLMDEDSRGLINREFIELCEPVESQKEIRNIFEQIRLNLPTSGNVLCKLRVPGKMDQLVDWKITTLQSSLHDLRIALLGYNVGGYQPMDGFNSIACPFPSGGVYIVQDGKFKFWNMHVFSYCGYEEAEMIDRDWLKVVHPADREMVRARAVSMLKGGDRTPYEYRYVRCSGETRWAMEMVVPVVYGGRKATLAYVEDITERKRMEETLQESENIYRTVFENSGTAMVMYGDDGIITMANKESEVLSGYPRSEVENVKKWTDFVAKENLLMMGEYHKLRGQEGRDIPRNFEFNLLHKDGTVKNIYLTVSLIPGTRKRVASLIDITARRQAEDRLKFLGTHDKLTGIYNRAFLDERLDSLQSTSADGFAVIVCDIDGLKLINDTFGHPAGDKALLAMGHILSECVHEYDVVARTGGDEFAILLNKAGYRETEMVCSSIRRSIEQYNGKNLTFPLSISLGFAIAEENSNNPYDLFKLADNNMYREKLLHSQSVRSSIVQIAMRALGERDFITEGHTGRLRDIVGKLLIAYAPNKCNPSDMILLAEFHDIGKVGIPDSILFKQGPLTEEERMEMQRHCEIGQRIAISSPELAPIADWILKHHERWDGGGYPLGLRGEQIPLACRILALADSYDAMTSDRPYRKAMSRRDALAEIARCAGTQFDPDLVRVFVRLAELGSIGEARPTDPGQHGERPLLFRPGRGPAYP